MTSGNFMIGKMGLSLQAFAKYIEPVFNKNGLTITDRLALSDGTGVASTTWGGVLTAISGENLEEKISSSYETIMEQVRSPQFIGKDPEIYNFNLPQEGYVTIGVYSDDKTASGVFPLIAQEYLIKKIEPSIEEVSEQIKSLLQKRLSDF